jgi:hypothetical protein
VGPIVSKKVGPILVGRAPKFALPHQNFIRISTLLERSKNLIEYRENSNYYKYYTIFSKL